MRIVTVRIEDNTEKINNIKQLEEAKRETSKCISDKIDEMQKEGFIQILAYIKYATQDYLDIVGTTEVINDVSWRYNRLNVSNISRSVRISADNNGVFIDFNYIGTIDCKNTPPRMEAKFKDDSIVITKSSRNGIRDLMRYWKTVKPEFQKEIDKVYKKKESNIKNDIENLKCLLNVAENFRV
ncbi:hypothetical protein [uncultured Eubacterium sp.]|uniref:hypothetical protein n=1 Tax=uncultured Eubacterium sp. TaxID=165185 RepID=UPI00259397A7|nr:hypothetical protein [uncultured Eubacterium sp.]